LRRADGAPLRAAGLAGTLPCEAPVPKRPYLRPSRVFSTPPRALARWRRRRAIRQPERPAAQPRSARLRSRPRL